MGLVSKYPMLQIIAQLAKSVRARPFRALALTIFMGLAVWVAARKTFDLGGVCLFPPQYISNEDVIRTAVNSINAEDVIKVETGPLSTLLRPQVPYADVDSFLTANPDCCSVVWGEEVTDDDSWFSALTGFGSVAVFVNFVATYRDDDGSIHRQKLFMMKQYGGCIHSSNPRYWHNPWNWSKDPEIID